MPIYLCFLYELFVLRILSPTAPGYSCDYWSESCNISSARYQTQFSSPQLRSRASLLRQQQQQQFQQEQLGLPTPGSGRGLFDQIVKRINAGHRENARRKQNQVGQQGYHIY